METNNLKKTYLEFVKICKQFLIIKINYKYKKCIDIAMYKHRKAILTHLKHIFKSFRKQFINLIISPSHLIINTHGIYITCFLN